MLDQDVPNQIVTTTEEQKTELSKLGHCLRAFAVADGVLVLFLTFGMVFPSKVKPMDENIGTAMPEAYYDLSAKASPLDIPTDVREPKTKIPVVSARNMPLPSQTPLTLAPPVQNVIYSVGQQVPMPRVSPADAEANLTMKKRTT